MEYDGVEGGFIARGNEGGLRALGGAAAKAGG